MIRILPEILKETFIDEQGNADRPCFLLTNHLLTLSVPTVYYLTDKYLSHPFDLHRVRFEDLRRVPSSQRYRGSRPQSGKILPVDDSSSGFILSVSRGIVKPGSTGSAFTANSTLATNFSVSAPAAAQLYFQLFDKTLQRVSRK